MRKEQQIINKTFPVERGLWEQVAAQAKKEGRKLKVIVTRYLTEGLKREKGDAHE